MPQWKSHRDRSSSWSMWPCNEIEYLGGLEIHRRPPILTFQTTRVSLLAWVPRSANWETIVHSSIVYGWKLFEGEIYPNIVTFSQFSWWAIRELITFIQLNILHICAPFYSEVCGRLWGSPPTVLHFGPKRDYITGSLFKQARYQIVIFVLYYNVIE